MHQQKLALPLEIQVCIINHGQRICRKHVISYVSQSSTSFVYQKILEMNLSLKCISMIATALWYLKP